jgi:hypothetical protein
MRYVLLLMPPLLAGWLGLPATSFAVTTADTITCGELAIAKDGVQEP